MSNTVGNVLLVACTIHDGSVLFIHGHLLGTAKHVDGSAIELDALLFANHGAASEHSDILEHLFAAIAKSRSLDCTHLERTTQTVHHQCCKCFAVDIFSNDEQRTAALGSLFENGKHILEDRDFLVENENEGMIHLALHLLGIGYKVGRYVATVELHTFDNIDMSIGTLGFLNGDNTVFLHFLHGLSNEFANLGIVVGRNASNILNLAEVVANFL